MVKVREFFCGCSLRSGTLAIAWTALICNCILFLFTLYQFFYIHRLFNLDNGIYDETDLPLPYIFAYNLIRTIVGIAISLITMWALHKNKVKFLNGLFWYFCYVVASLILSEILLIFQPNWEERLGELTPVLMNYNYEYFENIITLLIFYTFLAGILTYFALVVKSCRDYSLRNNAQNVQFVGPTSYATTVDFIAA